MKLSIVIPVFNEADNVDNTAMALEQTLSYLRQQHYDVEMILVNDGSRDDTLSRLETAFRNDPDVHIISHEQNQGIGAALRTGFKHSTGEIVITTDFDGTYDFNTIPQLLSHIIINHADIVTASPYRAKGTTEGVAFHRRLFSIGASLPYRLLVKSGLHTWTSLFRAYRRPVIENVYFGTQGFPEGTELLVNAIRAGFRVAEYPTTLHGRTGGRSSMKAAQVIKSHLRLQAYLLWQLIPGSSQPSRTPAHKTP
ncbi:MAG: glycosyltransferase family 2 protein [Anaerolineae bacterium]|nr:glycosyltransferase family 2 protein [Anaerolineae bacterium]